MIIYEITAIIRADLIEKYEKYMREQHIPDLLETGYFRGAEMMCSSAGRYRIRYEAFNQTVLDEYLKNEANRLREDFLNQFPEGIKVTRENWEVLESWKNNHSKI
ncbi:hypothetical protein BH10ACI1_BH10ACI1_08290 [soil metagenome]